MDKRIAIFIANGFEEIEALTVYDICYRAELGVELVSISSDTLASSSHGVRILCDRSINDEDFDFGVYDMLVLPGGMPGTTNLGASERLCEALLSHSEKGLPVAAICAAPSVLAKLGILSGKKATIYPGMEDHLVRGEAHPTKDRVVADGNTITSRGMGTAAWFGLAIVEHYCGHELAEKLRKSIVLE